MTDDRPIRPADLTGPELADLFGNTRGGAIDLLDRVLSINRWQAARIRELEMDKAMSPDPTREGIFRDHNCWLCENGKLPCLEKDSSRCSNPYARND